MYIISNHFILLIIVIAAKLQNLRLSLTVMHIAIGHVSIVEVLSHPLDSTNIQTQSRTVSLAKPDQRNAFNIIFFTADVN